MKLKRGKSYAISFMDPRQDRDTWYAGPATFVRKSDEDYGTGEQHYVFCTPDGANCTFPKTSITGPAVEID